MRPTTEKQWRYLLREALWEDESYAEAWEKSYEEYDDMCDALDNRDRFNEGFIEG